MLTLTRYTWLDRLLIIGAGVILLVLGLLAFTVLLAFMSVAALVLAVRWWWQSRRIRSQRPLTLEGDFQVVRRADRQ